MKQIGGLPICGVPYDEYVPEDRMLFGEISYGQPRCSSTLRSLFSVYYSILQQRDRVTIDDWILALFRSTSLRTTFPSPRDPFGIGSEDIEVQDYHAPDIPPCAAFEVDRRTFLAAFLACWLCYFVVPFRAPNQIRPEVFVAADQMACGVGISLATTALVNLYRSLRTVCASDTSGIALTLIPLLYLAGWLNLHFRGLYTPIVSERLRGKLPFLVEIAGAHATQLSPVAARLMFRKNSASHYTRNLFPNKKDLLRELKEYTDDGLGHDIHAKYISFEFLISIRTSWLPFRSGNDISFEAYHPHRCARQFGFDQMIPSSILDFSLLSPSLESLSLCWRFLLRRGTGSQYRLPESDRGPKCSYEYLKWHILHLKAYDSFEIEDVLGIERRGQKRGPPPAPFQAGSSMWGKKDLSLEFTLSAPSSVLSKRRKRAVAKRKINPFPVTSASCGVSIASPVAGGILPASGPDYTEPSGDYGALDPQDIAALKDITDAAKALARDRVAEPVRPSSPLCPPGTSVFMHVVDLCSYLHRLFIACMF